MGRSRFVATNTASPAKTTKKSTGWTPRAADLRVPGIRPTQGATSKDTDIHMWELFYASDGSVYGNMLQGELVAVHLLHAYPSVWFLMLKSLARYCEQQQEKDPGHPGTWKELCRRLKIRIATTAPARGEREVSDEDGIGTYVKNRVAIYCERANTRNVYCFLDAFIAWRVVTKVRGTDPEFARNPNVKIHVGTASTLTFPDSDAMKCNIEVVQDAPSTKLDVFQAYPPTWPPRLVIAHIESESESTVSIVFSGNTLPFATGFDAQEIAKKRRRWDAHEYGEWYRVCRNVDITDAARRSWLLDVFGAKILKSSPCVVRVVSCPAREAEFKEFYQELCALVNVRSMD